MKIKHITEAKLSPGERRTIDLKIGEYSQKLHDLDDYEFRLRSAETSGMNEKNEEILAKIEELKALYRREIEKLEAAVHKGSKMYSDYQVKMPPPLEKLLNGVVKNCGQALREMNIANRFIYRGMKYTSTFDQPDFFYGKSRDNRKPKDSVQEADAIFNRALELAGFAARRDNSIFVSGRPEHASSYGDVYFIFPKDGFDFTWSKKDSDMILGSSEVVDLIDMKKFRFVMSFIEMHPDIKEFITKCFYWIEGESDIGFADPETNPELYQKEVDSYRISNLFYNRWSKYSLITILKTMANPSADIHDRVPVLDREELDELRTHIIAKYPKFISYISQPGAGMVDFSNLVETYKYSNDSLAEALEAGHEIYIKGEFYAIHKKHQRYVKEYFKALQGFGGDNY